MELCIANNLCFLRHRHNYSLEALAEIISVSRQTVAKWETGASCPDLLNCVKLAALYKVSLDELVNKPLEEALGSEFEVSGESICGVVEISAENTLAVPQVVLDMFGISGGDKELLLADKRQGIAIIKCSSF